MLKLIDWIDIKKINWDYLTINPNAVSLLQENQDKIYWPNLSKNPNAIDLLKENQDKIYWLNLSKNPNAIDLLKENQDKINWYNFSKNPNIFTHDYKSMKENMKNSGIAEEIMSVMFHPKNMNKWINWGFTEHEEFINLINE
jgi:hypothetical protein